LGEIEEWEEIDLRRRVTTFHLDPLGPDDLAVVIVAARIIENVAAPFV